MLLLDYLSLGIKAGVVPRRVAKDIVRLGDVKSPFQYIIVVEGDCSVVACDGQEFGLDLIPWQLLLPCEVLSDFPALETARIVFEELTFWGSDMDSQELLAMLAEELNLFFS